MGLPILPRVIGLCLTQHEVDRSSQVLVEPSQHLKSAKGACGTRWHHDGASDTLWAACGTDQELLGFHWWTLARR